MLGFMVRVGLRIRDGLWLVYLIELHDDIDGHPY